MNKKYKIICSAAAVIAVIAIAAFAIKFFNPGFGAGSFNKGDNGSAGASDVSSNGLTEKANTDLSLSTAVAEKISDKSVDLMLGYKPGDIKGTAYSDAFINSAADFSLNLFKRAASNSSSSLVSPYSAMNALAMTANGAGGETLAQMEKVLGSGMGINELNGYMRTYNDALSANKDVKFSCANSIWFRDYAGLYIEPSFLQKNADYYGAAAYKAPFDNGTVKDINSWVNKETDGMIKNLLDEIEDESMMYLVNATAFEAKWMAPYTSLDIVDGVFNTYNGQKQNVKMLCSTESSYINYGGATGFIKPYKGNQFAFVALLPDAGTDINDYIASLSGDKFIATVKSANGSVTAKMPKFETEYSINLNNALKNMGMNSAFEDADFTKLGHCADGDLYISEVVQKTYISVTENGTRAGAATKVEMKAETSMMITNEVTLDRPFIYAIIDTQTNLPIFIGSVMSVG